LSSGIARFTTFSRHLALAFFFAALVVLPDLVYALLTPGYLHPTLATLKHLAIIWLLSALILAIPSRSLATLFFAILLFLGTAQQLHFGYFHSYIKPYEIPLLFTQREEVFETITHAWSYLILPLLLTPAILLLIWWLLGKIERPWTWRPMPWIVAFILLLGPLVASQRTRSYVFMPKAHALGSINTYTVLSWFLGKLGQERQLPEYPPYQIHPLPITPPQNVIVVMGESLNAKYMSLFGYPAPSTPNLVRLKRDPNFLYHQGYSCGVTTDVALPTFFLLKREPTNPNPIVDNRSNLFRLAKEQGYCTTFITMQNPMLLSGYIGGYLDRLISLKGYDERLLEALETIDWNQRNFIVLHQRSSHSPYEKYTPQRFWHFPFQDRPFHDYMLNSYLNSLRYTDWLLTTLFATIAKLQSPAVVFFTSDHGEMLGSPEEQGRYGHVILDFADAKVPFLIYHNGKLDRKLLATLNRLPQIRSHFQFGKLIANTLGYEVVDPEDNGSYYINGVDLLGRGGFLEYK